jgi:hypothetical protein
MKKRNLWNLYNAAYYLSWVLFGLAIADRVENVLHGGAPVAVTYAINVFCVLFGIAIIAFAVACFATKTNPFRGGLSRIEQTIG